MKKDGMQKPYKEGPGSSSLYFITVLYGRTSSCMPILRMRATYGFISSRALRGMTFSGEIPASPAPAPSSRRVRDRHRGARGGTGPAWCPRNSNSRSCNEKKPLRDRLFSIIGLSLSILVRSPLPREYHGGGAATHPSRRAFSFPGMR